MACLIRYDTLDDDEGEPIADLVALCQLRPMQPPPPTSARWLETLQIGWQLEVIAAWLPLMITHDHS